MRRDYSHAATDVDAYLHDHPESGEGWLLAARTARRQGNLGEASRFLQKAVNAGAKAADVALERRLVAYQGGNLPNPDDLVDQAARSAASDESALVLEALANGLARVQDGPRLRRAAEVWLGRYTAPADQALGFVWRGQAEKLANNVDTAIADFQQAIDLNPDYTPARVLIVASLVHDQPARAKPHVDVLLRQRPDDSEVLFQAARMHHYLGNLAESATLLDRVLTSGPNLAPALVERARVAMDLGRPEEADPLLRRALAAAPNNRLAAVAMADCALQLGKPDEAKRYADRAKELDEQRLRQPPPPKPKP